MLLVIINDDPKSFKHLFGFNMEISQKIQLAELTINAVIHRGCVSPSIQAEQEVTVQQRGDC